MSEKELSSNQPYIIRAMHEWINDNNLTPYIVVNTTYPEVVVPEEAIEDNQITLNLDYAAVRNLSIENDYIMFQAKFYGKPMEVVIPVEAVKMIFPQEFPTHGVAFHMTDYVPSETPPIIKESPVVEETNNDEPPPRGKPFLRVVK